MSFRTGKIALLAAGVIGLMPTAAEAHPTGLSYLDLDAEGALIHAKLELPATDLQIALDLDSNRDGQLEPADIATRQQTLTNWLGASLRVMGDGVPCHAQPAASELQPPLLTVRADFRCAQAPKDLTIAANFTDAIGAGFATFVRLRADAVARQGLVTGAAPSFSFSLVPSGGVWTASNIGRFLALGMMHIFTGYDHILFLIALLMIGGSFRRIIFIATSFTAAHTITLSLATLGLIHLPSRVVESGIAASIAYVACENFVHAAPSEREPLVLKWRWAITFFFGLIHGCGFASALNELGLTRAELPVALASFNVGVELGQVVIIALVYPVLRYVGGQQWYRPRGVRFASAGVFGIALYWLALRAFAG